MDWCVYVRARARAHARVCLRMCMLEKVPERDRDMERQKKQDNERAGKQTDGYVAIYLYKDHNTKRENS